MKRLSLAVSALLVLAALPACQKKATEPAAAPTAAAPKPVDLNALVAAVPTTGPREGNNYKVFFLVLRQDTSPAAGFKVDMWVKGKSQPTTVVTGTDGLATFTSLPFPDAKHHLNAILHYFRSAGNDDAREIDYPYIDSDAYRLKDTQYIPNTATAQ